MPETDKTPVAKKDISEYAGHFALVGKDKGCCGKLLGKVVIVVFLVNDEKTAWSDEEVSIFETVIKKSIDHLTSQSGFKKEKLNICYAYDKLPVQVKFDRHNHFEIADKVIRRYGDYNSLAAYQKHYEKKFKRDEAPIIFALHKDFRSFAIKAANSSAEVSLPDSDELSFVSYNDDVNNCVRTLVHELLHQFGAIDYYYHDELCQIANEVLPGSIMSSGMNIDALTRYIIGWDEEPDNAVFDFLERTKHITKEELRKARLKDNENDW